MEELVVVVVVAGVVEELVVVEVEDAPVVVTVAPVDGEGGL